MAALIIVAGFLVMMLVRLPIGYGLCILGFTLFAIYVPGGEVIAVAKVWNTLSDFTFTAIPFFLIMGEILLASGLSRRLFHAMAPLFRRIPGGLLHANIASCTAFASVSGSSISCAAGVGAVSYPELKRLGYNRGRIVASVAAGGTLGLLIPPSLSLLIYGATLDVSVGRLFLAGAVPGILLALVFMAFIFFQSLKDDRAAPRDAEIADMPSVLGGLLEVLPIIVISAVVLGSIYAGVATTTEAAALGVVATAAIGAIFGELTLGKCWNAIVDGIRVFAGLSIIIVGSLILGQAVTFMDLPRDAVRLINDLGGTQYEILLAVIILYLLLGCLLDGISLMLITLPIVFPIMMHAGFDPVWTGVIITILVEIGMLTPPVGMNIFVLTAITKGDVSLFAAARAVAPYWLLMLASIVVFSALPDLVLYLPRVAF